MREVMPGQHVLYHDPQTGVVCLGMVVDVHRQHRKPPSGWPKVNLVWWSREGVQDRQVNVPHGPGLMEHYWFRGETVSGGIPAPGA